MKRWHHNVVIILRFLFTTLRATLDRNLSVDQMAMEIAVKCFCIHLDLKLQWNVFKFFYLLFVFSICGQCIYNFLYSLNLVSDGFMISVCLFYGLLLCRCLVNEANTHVITKMLYLD